MVERIVEERLRGALRVSGDERTARHEISRAFQDGEVASLAVEITSTHRYAEAVVRLAGQPRPTRGRVNVRSDEFRRN